MEKIIEIPEGYEARIEGNKVVLEPKESEDERIRKIITDSVFYQYGADVEYKDVLDYLDKLEKQKIPEGSPSPDLTTMLVPNRYNEQKPAENPKSYDSMDNLLADALIEMVKESDLIDRDKKNRLVWIERHRTKPAEWSGEDEVRKSAIANWLAAQGNAKYSGFYAFQLIDWLNSLHPSPHWNPARIRFKHCIISCKTRRKQEAYRIGRV